MADKFGTSGDDRWDGTSDVDVYGGSGGIDTVSYLFDNHDGIHAGVTIDLSADGTGGTGSGGYAEGDVYYYISNIDGTDFADAVQGTNYANALKGAGGADLLKGAGGNDTLYSNAYESFDDESVDTLRGGSGDDAYFVDSVNDIVDEFVAGGSGVDTVYVEFSYSLSNTSIVKGDVENLTLYGTGTFTGTGNGLDNRIQGNQATNLLLGLVGADTLIGGAGIDTMRGGAGDDTYYIEDIGDRVEENVAGSNGIDTVVSAFSLALVNTSRVFGDVENLTLTGADSLTGEGNALANALTGNTGANLLTGLGGKDTLDGGGGVDTLRGGSGDDTYVVDNAADIVDETVAGSNGTDTVRASVTFDLATQPSTGSGVIENLTLTAGVIDGYGNGLANKITASDGPNTLDGRAGSDTLDGGAGADIMIGGTGNDRFYVDDADDFVLELSGEGSDVVYATASFALDADASIESLGVRDVTATTAISLTGNDIAQIITGNAGANTLSGGGGHDTLQGGGGGDLLYGGTGNDVFYVDTNGDRVRDADGEGFDTVYATASFGLFSTASIEVLRVLDMADTAPIELRGNSFSQQLIGNAGKNLLSGGGGNDTMSGSLGADTMVGGLGNDVFYVDNAGDVTTEQSGEGTDLVSSTVSHTLKANIENLNLNGAAAIDGNGNTAANIINGNAAANVLRGYEGADTLDGKGGADILLGGTSSDRLTPGVDTVQDIVRFSAVGDSTGSQRDIVTGMDLQSEDKFDFTTIPTSIGAQVNGGKLDLATINADLANAVDNNLAANGAVLFAPSTGGLSVGGHMFLVVDANGDGVYKPNQDYVVELIGQTGQLTRDDFM